MKFAITGASGFVGVHLIHHLLQGGHQVYAIKRPSSSLYTFELVKGYYNLNDGDYSTLFWRDIELYDTHSLHELFLEVDQVVHAAGFISYNRKEKDLLKQVNHEYTENLIDASISAQVTHFIYISSTGAIPKPELQNIDESNAWDNKLDHTYYGKTKYLGELEVHRGKQEGLKISILNPGVILGYGNWNNGSLKLFKNAYKRFPFYTTGTTGFIGVKDICKVVDFLSTASQYQNDQFILISENHSFNFISKTMAKYFNVKPPSIKVSGVLYKLTYLFIYIKESLGWSGLLTTESTKASISKHSFNNSKLTNTIPFALQPIELVIKDACNAYDQKRPTLR